MMIHGQYITLKDSVLFPTLIFLLEKLANNENLMTLPLLNIYFNSLYHKNSFQCCILCTIFCQTFSIQMYVSIEKRVSNPLENKNIYFHAKYFIYIQKRNTYKCMYEWKNV